MTITNKNSYLVRLLPSEQRVLLELAKGHDNMIGIARAIGCSRHTINTHLSNMMAKTGTRNQIQLLRWAFGEARRITATPPSGIRCDCGRMAKVTGKATILSADDRPHQVVIVLCDGCRQWFDGETTPL